MTLHRVLVLGGGGMLGSAVRLSLQRNGLETYYTSRAGGIRFDVLRDEVKSVILEARLEPGDFVVNCIGVTKGNIRSHNQTDQMNAITINSLFPFELQREAQALGLRVIQVATDCVFSGLMGKYTEMSTHDATDVYGKTKSLGEPADPNLLVLRCSLIGPELARNTLFFEWLRQLPAGSEIQGYENHRWNGLTSLAFAKIVTAIVENNLYRSGTYHLVPSDTVTKLELVRLVLAGLGRRDVRVKEFFTEQAVDRTLDTLYPELSISLFQAAGYESTPSISHLVSELCLNLSSGDEA